MEDIKNLYDVRYQMDIGGGFDVWRIHGTLEDGQMRMTSSPIQYDRENAILTTHTGSRYKIQSFIGEAEKTIAQIEKDIAKGGYETY